MVHAVHALEPRDAASSLKRQHAGPRIASSPLSPPGPPLPRSGLWSFTEEAIPPPCPDLRLALKREMPNPARTRLSILSVLTPERLGDHRRRGWSTSRLISFQFQTATLSLPLRCFPRRPVHTKRILYISRPDRMEGIRCKWCIFLPLNLQRRWCVGFPLPALFCGCELFLLVSQASALWTVSPLASLLQLPLLSGNFSLVSTEPCPPAFIPAPACPSSDNQTVPLDLMFLSGHTPISLFSWSLLEKLPVHMISDPRPPLCPTNDSPDHCMNPT